jgi:ribonucleoside-triphosphate reductase
VTAQAFRNLNALQRLASPTSSSAVRTAATTNPDGNGDHLSFHLDEDFVAMYASVPVDWGFPVGGGLSLGEFTYLSKYAGANPDGTKESWAECVARVINGMYSIQRNYCVGNLIPFDMDKAQVSAQEAYQRHHAMKWTAPGRGLEKMGTRFVHTAGSASLQNCSFWSTKNMGIDPTKPFVRLMEESMLGIGVGFDTKGSGQVLLREPDPTNVEKWIVPDSREGWCESLRLLLASYFEAGHPTWEFDYSLIRPAGEPLKTFGGTASGPEPLRRLHLRIRTMFLGRAGETITSRDIVDIANLIGQAVVAGAKRRAAEIALGEVTDTDFIGLKDWNDPKNTDRTASGTGWAWTSNNSVLATADDDLHHIIEKIEVNGEPGIVFLDMLRNYGRLVDGEQPGIDGGADGVNPCAEQPLDGRGEKCTLVEVHLNRAESREDFLRTLKFAFLYGKTVTLLPTHWDDVNAVMARNRRIGVGLTGVAEFVETHGMKTLRAWMDAGYREVRRWDKVYSEWLAVRESIKVTTLKPAGSTSLLSGATPGVHWAPLAGRFKRTMRFHKTDPMVAVLAEHGFHIEPDQQAPETTVVVTFAAEGPVMRDQYHVSLWEKASLAAEVQHWWSDNGVSVTLTYLPHEKADVRRVIDAFTGRLKTMSFIPIDASGIQYPQAPFQPITDAEFEELRGQLTEIPQEELYGMQRATEGDKFCDGDTCVL